MSPYLARIDIFPIKSLDGVSVSQARVLASGALQDDRAYALVDAQNRFINGKRNAAVHRLRSTFGADRRSVTWTVEGTGAIAQFDLDRQRPALEVWLSEYFQQPVRLQENRQTGFPDDTAANGPTLISRATLATVASWYPHLTVAEVRRRLRTNLEIDGVPAFWEDRLFSPNATPVRFTLGAVVLEGINPCQRCVVPTRDSVTGQPSPDFQTIFSQRRAATLPPWTHPNRFNHFYRLAVNTNILNQAGRLLTVGDPLQLLP
ncbi:MAG TPA: MOSC N-terminal beta barrel domain-containing protein [Leptolyngbyaceae cyanobacterium M65_K2018_010]|nr:MOSC N-terminal beta barrel domain-containing protein [Leptolyngbyaceae cyanobacterium M65_K2018_010]